MSIQQLEQRIRSLSPEDLAKFGQWFDAYRSTVEEPATTEDDAELSAEQRAELDRRLDELDADPSIAVPWEGTIEEVKKLREEILAEKTPSRRD
jgi:putative addiction module component (TIGR02574 family)